jgi:hypothetical protein
MLLFTRGHDELCKVNVKAKRSILIGLIGLLHTGLWHVQQTGGIRSIYRPYRPIAYRPTILKRESYMEMEYTYSISLRAAYYRIYSTPICLHDA